MAMQGALSGERLAGKYLLGELLGQGGMGAVYKAADMRLNRVVAVKVMSPAGSVSAGGLERFRQMFEAEALRLAGLKHPSIPHIYEYFEEGGRWFLVMEFIEGVTLKEYQEQRGGCLPVKEVLEVGLRLAAVLEYLHSQQPPIIFRDLKPANVMVAPGGQVYLIDFGIARVFTPGKAQDTFVALSQGYAAPEQYGAAQTTVRSDIYSLGATLHHLLSGKHPARSPFVFAPLSISRPAQLASLVAQMVEFDEHKRPGSMGVVKDALRRMVDEGVERSCSLPKGSISQGQGRGAEGGSVLGGEKGRLGQAQRRVDVRVLGRWAGWCGLVQALLGAGWVCVYLVLVLSTSLSVDAAAGRSFVVVFVPAALFLFVSCVVAARSTGRGEAALQLAGVQAVAWTVGFALLGVVGEVIFGESIDVGRVAEDALALLACAMVFGGLVSLMGGAVGRWLSSRRRGNGERAG